MKYGYSRVSSIQQNYEGQVERLVEYGVSEDCIRVEKVSVTQSREEINSRH